MKKLSNWRCAAAGALVAGLLIAMPAAIRAQANRAELVERGIDHYLGFQSDSAIAYLVASVDPRLEAEVVNLKRGVQFLAQTLLSEDEEDLAGLWMRWAVRHFGEMQIDSAEFDDPESIGNSYQSAVGSVGESTPGDSVTRTAWEWPAFGVPEISGTVRLDQVGLTPGVTVTVADRGAIQPGRTLTLPVGSYVFEAQAEGHETVQVTREVPPGVMVVLGFDLAPVVVEEVALAPDVLPADVESVVRDRVARFTVTRYGTDPTCGTGFFVSNDGLLLTTYSAIRGGEHLEVTLPDGTRVSEDVGIVAWDTRRNVAFVKLPVPGSDSLTLTTDMADDQWGWSLAHPQCSSATVTPVQVARWLNRPAGLLELSISVVGGEQGGPIINQSGAVIGLAAGGNTAIPADQVIQGLANARGNITADRLTSLQDVASEENHLFGSVRIQSTLTNATASVSPLEEWQWPQTAATGPVPFTFTGPMGSYRLELQTGEAPAHVAEFQIDPGVLKEVNEPQVVAAGGRKFPWPIALLGAAGAAVAGVLVLGGGGDDGGNGGETPTRGSVVIILPHRR